MKTILSLVFSLIVGSVFSQVYLVKYDSTFIAVCDNKISYNEMVKTQNFEVVYEDRNPGVIVIHVDMMIVFGKNGEAFIEDIKQIGNKMVFTTKFGDKIHVFTLQKNEQGGDDLLIEYDISDTQKYVVYNPNVTHMFE